MAELAQHAATISELGLWMLVCLDQAQVFREDCSYENVQPRAGRRSRQREADTGQVGFRSSILKKVR